MIPVTLESRFSSAMIGMIAVAVDVSGKRAEAVVECRRPRTPGAAARHRARRRRLIRPAAPSGEPAARFSQRFHAGGYALARCLGKCGSVDPLFGHGVKV